MPGGIQVPVEQWLEWPVPNYINPQTRSSYVLIVACVLGPISIALLFARLWVRTRMQHNTGLDDILMLAALVTERYRFNRHVWDVELQYFPIQRKYVMAISVLFTLASGLVKMSVLLFYRRLSSRAVSPAFRWVMRIMTVVVGGYTVAFVVVLVFACRPFTAFWDQVDFSKTLRSGGYKYSCINEGADIVANGIVSTALDLIVAFLPTLLCSKLQMPPHQKIALYAIFSISYTTVAIGALRTWTAYRIYFQTYDVTWAANDTFLFTLLELHIGSICANAPALKIFFKHFLSSERLTKLISSRSSKSQSKGQRPTDPSSATDTGLSRSSAWVRIGFWKSKHSRDASAYLSSSNTNVTTDGHGGIIHVTDHAQPKYDYHDRNRGPIPFKPEYMDTIVSWRDKDDVELGSLPSRARDNRRSDIQALPPISRTPPPSWLKPIRSSSPFPAP